MRVAERHRKTIDPPPWPWSKRPRVLVEAGIPAVGLEFANVLRHAGYPVAVCPGPEASDRCPVTAGEPCPLAEGADVIVTNLGLDRQEARDVVEGLRRRYASRPLVVSATPEEAARYPSTVAGCEIVTLPAPPEELVAAVGRALATQKAAG